MLFAVIAVPLGLRAPRGSRSWGVLAAAVLVFAYYSLLSFSHFLAREMGLAPALAMWAPNALLAGVGAALVLRARRDRSP